MAIPTNACMLRVTLAFTDGTSLPVVCHSLDVRLVKPAYVAVRFILDGDTVTYPAETIDTIRVEPA